MHWRIQIELAYKPNLEEPEEIKLPHGQHYVDLKMPLEVVKLHVNDHHSFQDTMNERKTYGGCFEHQNS
jgi:hypothetical protein